MPPKRRTASATARATAAPAPPPPATPPVHAPPRECSYLLNIQVQDIDKPRVTRMLSVPPSTTFWTLHRAIQIAFDWGSSHAYGFEITNVPSIWLGDGDPPPPKGPHILLTIGNPKRDQLLGADDPIADQRTTKLSDVFEQEKYHNKLLTYTYDFGDGWEHFILVLGRADPSCSSNEIFCLGGEGAPIAEDCGGPPGWEGLKEIVTRRQRGRKLDDEQRNRFEWFKEVRNGDCEIWDWNLREVNINLSKLGTT
jgi:Plasmid pRiA4b ORF-3-like protein